MNPGDPHTMTAMARLKAALESQLTKNYPVCVVVRHDLAKALAVCDAVENWRAVRASEATTRIDAERRIDAALTSLTT